MVLCIFFKNNIPRGETSVARFFHCDPFQNLAVERHSDTALWLLPSSSGRYSVYLPAFMLPVFVGFCAYVNTSIFVYIFFAFLFVCLFVALLAGLRCRCSCCCRCGGIQRERPKQRWKWIVRSSQKNWRFNFKHWGATQYNDKEAKDTWWLPAGVFGITVLKRKRKFTNKRTQ